MRHEKLYRCKYCGAILKRDIVGKYCPTRNCQWQYGVSEEKEAQDLPKSKRMRGG